MGGEVKYRNLFSMGTRLDLVLVDAGERLADELVSKITSKLEYLEDQLSIYRQDSEISILNREAHKSPVIVTEKLFSIISRCKDIWQFTNGKFDISSTALNRLWNEKRVVTPGETEKIAERIGMDKVFLNSSALSVKFENSIVELDSGGFGKGMAIEEIRQLITDEGVTNALVSFGESSVVGIGKHPHGPYWPIGISNIYETSSFVKVIEVVDNTVSTSGTGYTTGNGKFVPSGNVINPSSTRPISEPKTVSVKCKDAFLAEALSTALLIDNNCLRDGFYSDVKIEAYEVIYNADKQFVISELTS